MLHIRFVVLSCCCPSAGADRSLGTTPISGKTLSEWQGHSRKFPDLTWLFAIFTRKRAFALFCDLLCSFALFCGLAFALFCGHLRSFARCAHLRVSANDRVWNDRVWELQTFSELWERSGVFSEQLSHSRNGISRHVRCGNQNSRSNSRSDSRNWWEATWKIFICPCTLEAVFQELGWFPRFRNKPSLMRSIRIPRGPCDWKNSIPIDRVKFSIHTIEIFNPGLKISISIEIFNLTWKFQSRPW